MHPEAKKVYGTKATLIALVAAIAWCFYLGEVGFSVVFVFIVIFLVSLWLTNAEALASNQKLLDSIKAEKVQEFERSLGIAASQDSSDWKVYYGTYIGGHKGYPLPAKVGLAFLPDSVRLKSIAGERQLDIDVAYASISNFEIVTPTHPYVMNLNVAGALTNALAASSAAAKRMLSIEFNDDLGFVNGVLVGALTGISPEQLSEILYKSIAEMRARQVAVSP